MLLILTRQFFKKRRNLTKPAIILSAVILYNIQGLSVSQYANAQCCSELNQASDPANNIMDKVINRAQKNETEKQKHLSCLRTYEVYNLTPDSKPNGRDDQSVTRIQPNGDKSVEEIIEEDGRPVHKRSPDDNIFDLVSTLRRWQFTLASPSIIAEGGKDYIVINFKPKDKKLPEKTYLDSIANDLKGVFYIDIEDLYIRKMDGALIGPLSFGGGLVKVPEITVHIEQEQRSDLNNIVVVDSVTAIPRYSINYILYRRNRYQRRTWNYTNYQYIQ